MNDDAPTDCATCNTSLRRISCGEPQNDYNHGRLLDWDGDELVILQCHKCKGWPTDLGHDPCIANLPGVKFACCGHGMKGRAYVVFNNDLTLRGEWED